MGIAIVSEDPKLSEDKENQEIKKIAEQNPELKGKEEAINRVLDRKQKELGKDKSGVDINTRVDRSLYYDGESKTFKILPNNVISSPSPIIPDIEFSLDEVLKEQEEIDAAAKEKKKKETKKKDVKEKYSDDEL